MVEALDHVTLASTNLRQTIQYYQTLFDFEVMEETEKSVILWRDPYKLFFQYMIDFTPLTKNPGHFSLSFSMDMDDFTLAIKELEERKVEILVGPLALEKGESMVIADPDGHLIELYYHDES